MAFNQLTDAQDERLSVLAEECAEVIQVIQKIQRHGYESYHPDCDVSAVITNRTLLETELGHVQAAMDMMRWSDDIQMNRVYQAMHEKLVRVQKYLHHQPDEMFLGAHLTKK
jgi:hypothetical protein